MIQNKKILAVIPARGGSKGVPGKNIKMTAGKPLVAWTIEAAKQSKYIDRIVVTSDDPKIIETCRELGCEAPFIRPSSLSGDDSSLVDVALHAWQSFPEYELIMLLQPTSPLRTTRDIDGSLQRLIESGATSVVSVTEVSKSPHWMYELSPEGRMKPFLPQDKLTDRRQLLPALHVLNGAIYVVKSEALKTKRSFLFPDSVAWEMDAGSSIDVDTQLDLDLASFLLSQRSAP